MRFCEGKPERGARPLEAAERRALEVAARRAGRKAVFAIAGLAAPFVVGPAGALGAALLGADPEGAAAVVGTLAFFALLGGLPVAIVFAREALRAARALRRDLRRGEVLRFGEGAEELVVLAASHHLVGRAGAVVAPVRRVAVGEAAPPPLEPPTYALSPAEVPGDLREGAWVKRALSADERGEIERHSRRFGRISPLLVLFSLVFAAGTAASLSRDSGPGEGLLPGVALAVVLGLDWWRVLRDRRAAARLRADAEEGWAYRGLAGSVEACEVLPASGAFWTSSGAPAAWRLAVDRRPLRSR